MKKIITWIKPTWEQPHIWNLFWAMLPFKSLCEWNDAALFIPDLHALSSVKDGEILKKNSFEAALTFLSVLWKDTKVTIFRQSDIVLIPKLNWFLNNFTPYSLMLRAHSFKDAKAKWVDLNMWVFNYPILMAADILGYDIDIVPVWKDQKQHIEFARDIAWNINSYYNTEIFKLPEAYIEKTVATIPGLDWKKMSKSYGNFIGIFEDEKILKQKIMSIPTDSKGLEEPKDPDNCNVFALVKLIWKQEQQKELKKKYLAGNYGYWNAKLELFEIMKEFLKPYKEAREELLKNPDFIEKKLQEWAKIMNARIEITMERFKKYIWI